MAFAPTSPVTGSTITGLTSPTYTLLAGTAPAAHGKQYYVSALGGTQTGVEVHSISNPFTVTMFVVPNPKGLPTVNPVTGALQGVPKNTFKVGLRKGIEVVSGQPRQVLPIDVSIAIPANTDVQDPESLKAALSCLFGLLHANANAIYDSLAANAT